METAKIKTVQLQVRDKKKELCSMLDYQVQTQTAGEQVKVLVSGFFAG